MKKYTIGYWDPKFRYLTALIEKKKNNFDIFVVVLAYIFYCNVALNAARQTVVINMFTNHKNVKKIYLDT